MQIRKMIAQDRALFLQLEEEFNHTAAVLHPTSAAVREDIFAELCQRDTYFNGWILEQAGAVAGFAVLSKAFATEVGGLVLWLEELYVRPAFQGQGLGSAFLEWIKGQYPACRRIRLEVAPENPRARALYARMGFSDLGYVQMVKDWS